MCTPVITTCTPDLLMTLYPPGILDQSLVVVFYSCSLQIARQILEAHASMLSLTVADAKLQYIRNWQALQDFGITYFVVKVGRNKKEVSACLDCVY